MSSLSNQGESSLSSAQRVPPSSSSENQNRNKNSKTLSPEIRSTAIPLSILDVSPKEDSSTHADSDNDRKRSLTLVTLTRLVLSKGLTIAKHLVLYFCIIICVWTVIYIFFDSQAYPGGDLFGLMVLVILGTSAGKLVTCCHLPPMFGMLIVGILLRNLPMVNVGRDIGFPISSPLRGLSVVILLTRGAFSVNTATIKKYKRTILPVVVGSSVAEAVCGSIAAHFILGLPGPWASLSGAMASAMSGVLTVPYLNEIHSNFVKHDVNATENAKTIVEIARVACGLDCVVAIFLTECSLGFIFGADLKDSVLKGFGDVVLGLTFAVLWGSVVGILATWHTDVKILGVFSGGTMSLLGLTKLGHARGGPLGTFVGTLIAIQTWRRRKSQGLDRLLAFFDNLWFIFQPLLFGILGCRTALSDVDWTMMYRGAICLAISMTARLVSCFFLSACSGLGLSGRERLFLLLSWMGKGTVQAALSPVAFETALQVNPSTSTNDQLANGLLIMNLAVMTIIICSSCGSWALKFCGEKVLRL